VEHEIAEHLLEDWSAGRLPAERALEVEAHARACRECGPHADLLRAIRREISAHGEALFTPHPSADELAHLALEAETLPAVEAARLGAHLRACPSCAAERDLIVTAARPALLRSLRTWLGDPAADGSWRTPALAVVVLALVWPAWLGLVEYPRARAAAAHAHAIATPTPAAAPAWDGGAASVLVLSGTARASAAAPLPVARLGAGQPALAIVVDRRLEAAGLLEVSLEDGSGRPTWQTRATAEQLWDAGAQVSALMIPAAALAGGEHRLVIALPDGHPLLECPFRIERSPQ